MSLETKYIRHNNVAAAAIGLYISLSLYSYPEGYTAYFTVPPTVKV